MEAKTTKPEKWTCKKCFKTKELNDFVPDDRRGFEYRQICRECNDNKVKRDDTKKTLMTHLTCKKCLKTLPVEEFVKDSKKIFGYRQICLTDSSLYRKRRRQENLKKNTQ